MAYYGPPKYDVSFKAIYNQRVLKQAALNKPTAMYSSDWHHFGAHYLRRNKFVQQELRKIAIRGLFALKREIPLGDAEDGHLRNELKINFHRRAGTRRDRMGYTVDYVGGKPHGWNAAVRRSTFASPADFKNAARGIDGTLPSWVERAAKRIDQ